jgi:hypothetical protein
VPQANLLKGSLDEIGLVLINGIDDSGVAS